MTKPKALDVAESFLLDWDMEAVSSRYSAQRLLETLEAKGYYICRMDGGVHTGSCPTCGCAPCAIGETVIQEK